ncbi:MAG: hypothetical protein KJO08_08655, partial [Gammaproteobacteria bacterium]|nr:hypothetical protein [Gammaproteobacteria bacterium]
MTITPLVGLGLAATEFGTRWLVRDVLPAIFASMSNDRLLVQAADGTLLSSLTLTGITHHATHSMAKPTFVDSVHLQWHPGALFSGLLHIQDLRIDGIHHDIPHENSPPDP